ncbi:hypothetical protein AMTR_s00044p00196990 [Amborella trichopoda]|uniref:Uncharacterized protein n=1 Tax=Amborella trichopoda TaxID=13333 RepID=U5D4U7_AMBTC|nr:hypothetical protein AMTR_s00044p00196990 [Amborella trichopoda]
MELRYAINDEKPAEPDDDTTLRDRQRFVKWKNDDFTCRGAILNCLSDRLHKVSECNDNAKDLWAAIDKRHTYDNCVAKCELYERYNMYKMKENQPLFEYFDDMCIMANQLAGFGEPIRKPRRGMLDKRVALRILPLWLTNLDGELPW